MKDSLVKMCIEFAILIIVMSIVGIVGYATNIIDLCYGAIASALMLGIFILVTLYCVHKENKKEDSEEIKGDPIKQIGDIRYLIMEFYSDTEPLTPDQKASRDCFYRYCDNIKSFIKLQNREIHRLLGKIADQKASEASKIRNITIEEFIPLDLHKKVEFTSLAVKKQLNMSDLIGYDTLKQYNTHNIKLTAYEYNLALDMIKEELHHEGQIEGQNQ